MMRRRRLAAALTVLALAGQLAAPGARAAAPGAPSAGPDPRHAAVWRCLQQRFPTATLRPIAASELAGTLARLRAAGHRVIEFPAIPLHAIPLSAESPGAGCPAIMLATERTPAVTAAADGEPDPPEAGRREAPPDSDEQGEDAAADPEHPGTAGEPAEHPNADRLEPAAAPSGGSDAIEVAGRIGGECGEDCAPLLFVVLGVVVIWFAVAGIAQIGYNLAAKQEGPPLVFGAEARLGLVSEESDGSGEESEEVIDEAWLTAVKTYAAARAPSGTEVGLAAELGRLSGTFGLQNEGESESVSGNYWLLGPTVMLLGQEQHPERGRLYVDLLFGQLDDEAVDRMAIARFGFNVPLPGNESLYYGVSIGALFLELDADRGLIRDEGNINLIVTGALGASF